MDLGRFRRIRLYTSKLNIMRSYYAEVLDLPVTASADGQSFTVIFGQSELEFVHDATDFTAYHFAVNIPENMFDAAKRWLSHRTPLLRDSETDQDQRFFANWNAHAVYFADPAGNLGELIARHTLPMRGQGAFGPDKMLHLSEIGLVSPNPDKLAKQLMQQYSLSMYGDSSFFIGDEYGLFVLPEVGRRWIPQRRQLATINPLEIDLRGPGGKLMPSGLPFVIETCG